ncbi:MAG: hypothetical protein ACI4EF_10620 [Coprococcus sp.]
MIKQKFSLHYDFGDDWMFTITVQNITETAEKTVPKVIKEKGGKLRIKLFVSSCFFSLFVYNRT